MRYSILLASTSLMIFPAAAQAAECRPTFVNGDQHLVIDGVEIEPGGRVTRDFQVRVQNSAESSNALSNGPGGSAEAMKGGPCGAIIRVARVGATSNTDVPPYSLRAPGNQEIEILPDHASGGTTESDVIIANAPPGPQGRAVPFQVGVSTEWGLRAGDYVERLELALIGEDGEITDRSTLTITIVIPAAVSLRLVGAVVGSESGGPAQIDLGSLSNSRETSSPRFGARIFSTAPYLVSFDSDNRGHLLHEHGREQVPYRLYFDGALVDLAGSSEFAYLDHTPRGGDRRPMKIVVPPVVALAGRYSDRITVTVTAM